jgi:hypothetical protein
MLARGGVGFDDDDFFGARGHAGMLRESG